MEQEGEDAVSELKRKLEADLVIEKSLIGKALSEVDELKAAMDETEMRADNLLRRNVKMVEERRESDAKIAELMEEIAIKSTEFEGLEKESSMKDLVIAETSESILNSLVKIECLEKEVGGQSKKNKELEKKITKYDLAINEADATTAKQREEIAGLWSEIENLKRELSVSAKQKSELAVQLRNLETSKGEAEQVQAQICIEMDSRNQEIKQLKSKVKEKEDEISRMMGNWITREDEIRKVIDSKNQLETKLKKKELETNRMMGERDLLENEVKELQDEMDKVMDSKKELLKEKDDEINRLMEKLNDSKSEELKTELGIKENEIEILAEEKRVLESMIGPLSEKIGHQTVSQVKMASEMGEKMNQTLKGIETLRAKFEEDFGELKSRMLQE